LDFSARRLNGVGEILFRFLARSFETRRELVYVVLAFTLEEIDQAIERRHFVPDY
jgi:hypothetical protein